MVWTRAELGVLYADKDAHRLHHLDNLKAYTNYDWLLKLVERSSPNLRADRHTADNKWRRPIRNGQNGVYRVWLRPRATQEDATGAGSHLTDHVGALCSNNHTGIQETTLCWLDFVLRGVPNPLRIHVPHGRLEHGDLNADHPILLPDLYRPVHGASWLGLLPQCGIRLAFVRHTTVSVQWRPKLGKNNRVNRVCIMFALDRFFDSNAFSLHCRAAW